MKKVITVLIFFALVGCKEDNATPCECDYVTYLFEDKEWTETYRAESAECENKIIGYDSGNDWVSKSLIECK